MLCVNQPLEDCGQSELIRLEAETELEMGKLVVEATADITLSDLSSTSSVIRFENSFEASPENTKMHFLT